MQMAVIRYLVLAFALMSAVLSGTTAFANNGNHKGGEADCAHLGDEC
jgi:hypothetical protein